MGIDIQGSEEKKGVGEDMVREEREKNLITVTSCLASLKFESENCYLIFEVMGRAAPEKYTIKYIDKRGSIWLERVGHSTNINFMGEVMSTEANLGNTGVRIKLSSEGNSVVLYCHCIIVNKASK